MTDDKRANKPDRYKSFAGIDCMGDSRRIIQALRRHIDDPDRTNAFWQAFKRHLADAEDTDGSKPDVLRLVCSNVYYIEELFEHYGDEEGLILLQRLEEECC